MFLSKLLSLRYRSRRVSYLSWEYFSAPTTSRRVRQRLTQLVLTRYANARFSKNCYVSPDAKIYTNSLVMATNSYVCGGTVLRHDITIGSSSGIGSNCHIAGSVTLGVNTVVANSVSIFGFNHGTDIASPMSNQPCTTLGVWIGDDCWIGANSTILDGVSIGSHSIVAAGAVVTKTFPEWSVIGGVPARLIKSRLS
jgi:acetyltransferase-like isoleucine patch superfamily enzyme